MSEPRYLTYAEQEAALAEKDKRLASLQALMERVEHKMFYAQHSSGDSFATGCVEDCLRCAYAKLLEEWK